MHLTATQSVRVLKQSLMPADGEKRDSGSGRVERKVDARLVFGPLSQTPATPLNHT